MLRKLVNMYVPELKPAFNIHYPRLVLSGLSDRYSTHTNYHTYLNIPIFDPGSHFRLPSRPSNFAVFSDINVLGIDKGGSQ